MTTASIRPHPLPGPSPWVAVIIPHYNDVARLVRCLDVLMAAGTAGAEVVVVDNGSSEDLEPVRRAHPGLRIVTEARKGAAAARNAGVRATTAPALLFLDADCIPAPDWLQTAAGLAGVADLIGGRIDVFDETPPPRSGAEAFETVFAFDCRAYVEQKGFSVTANLMTRRAVFLDVGDFIVGLSEDLDWCHRATAKGYSLGYADTLRAGHPTRSDWPALRRKWHRLTAEAFALHGSAPRPSRRVGWALRALAMPVSALMHLPKLLTSDRLRGPGERLRGAATLVRLRLVRMCWMLRQSLGLPI
jgi:GT2 family glycosyltransferase